MVCERTSGGRGNIISLSNCFVCLQLHPPGQKELQTHPEKIEARNKGREERYLGGRDEEGIYGYGGVCGGLLVLAIWEFWIFGF